VPCMIRRLCRCASIGRGQTSWPSHRSSGSEATGGRRRCPRVVRNDRRCRAMRITRAKREVQQRSQLPGRRRNPAEFPFDTRQSTGPSQRGKVR
jgi:hypothetical protein